ncbi:MULTISPECIES: cyclase family protein [unclassified Haematobacter]|uniref:cyclase family protein n=1 Tax=unclassified Haematobacter TaxID=2640585 RepID=UPI0025BD2D77|nr:MULTISPECIES: cyclase family protein [unclassified Haematobacter]
MPEWVNRPEKSNWGDFGPDDQLGTLNYITDARRMEAAAEIREGRAYCLSLPLDVPGPISLNPRRKPPRLAPTCSGETPYINFPLSNVDPLLQDVISDDQVLMSMQFSTQWDSLAHVGALFDADGDGVAERCYYNGHLAGRDILGPEARGPNTSFAERLSITEMAKTPVQGRGVLVDLVRHFGMDRTVVGRAALHDAMRAQGVVIREGDILLLRTGFAEALLDMQASPDPARLERTGAVLDGADETLHDWITESRISAIAADNYAVEDAHADREDCCLRLPLHHHCLFKIGLPLAELWYLRDLAAALEERGRHAVFLTAPPLYMPGAVGSPVTPVATI